MDISQIKTDVAWQKLKKQKQIYRDVINKAKTNALSDKVMECGKDTKKLYKFVNSILGTIKKNTCQPQMTKLN